PTRLARCRLDGTRGLRDARRLGSAAGRRNAGQRDHANGRRNARRRNARWRMRAVGHLDPLRFDLLAGAAAPLGCLATLLNRCDLSRLARLDVGAPSEVDARCLRGRRLLVRLVAGTAGLHSRRLLV
ncbi:hypothetical protein C1I95_34680, partial [Micromonospora craterilacus]